MQGPPRIYLLELHLYLQRSQSSINYELFEPQYQRFRIH